MPPKSLLTNKRRDWAAKRKEPPRFEGFRLAHNAAVQERYASALDRLVSRMTAEVGKEVRRLFETDAASSHFGQDATIASQSRITMRRLADTFSALFAKAAAPVARQMVDGADKTSKSSLYSSLQKLSGGLSLKTDVSSPALTNVYKAAVAENVGLIKSIADQYLQKVQGSVMRSITTGNGLQDLIPALEQYEGQTHRRARNIALDQTRKTYNAINKGRMQAIGIQSFKWLHSGGGANPREDHVEMDGKVYRFDNLPVIDQRTGERGIPGQSPNCKCTMSPVFDFTPGDDDGT